MSKDAELLEIYSEMDTKGKKKMVAAAAKLLSAQKTLGKEQLMSNIAAKVFIQKEARMFRFGSMPRYLVTGVLLLFTVYVFWSALISPALLMVGVTPLTMARIIITALIGTFCLSSGLVGIMFRKMSLSMRILVIAAGLGCLDPALLTDIIGFAVLAAIITLQIIQGKREQAFAAR